MAALTSFNSSRRPISYSPEVSTWPQSAMPAVPSMSEEMKIFKVAGRLCRDGVQIAVGAGAAAVLGSARLNRLSIKGEVQR